MVAWLLAPSPVHARKMFSASSRICALGTGRQLPVQVPSAPQRAARRTRSRKRLSCSTETHVHLVGFGLAGAALAFYLCERASQSQRLTISVVDSAGAGCAGGATHASAGILHPFTPRGRKIWLGDEGLICMREILGVISEKDSSPVARRSGLLRLATTDREAADYAAAATQMYPQQLYWDAARSQLYIPDAWVVDAPAYVRAIRRYLERNHSDKLTLWETREVRSVADECRRLQSLAEASCAAVTFLVIAAGASSRLLIPSLPLTWCGGHNLVFRSQDLTWPSPEFAAASTLTAGFSSTSAPGSVPLIGHGSYLVPTPDGTRVIGGATKEYGMTATEVLKAQSRSPSEQMARATSALRQPLSALLGRYANLAERYAAGESPLSNTGILRDPLEALYGVRALPPRSALGAVPLLGEIQHEALSMLASTSIPENTRVLYFTGLGSRGLIHHGIIGRLAADAVLRGESVVSLGSVASPTVLSSVRRAAAAAVAAS
jgi:glycine/D-amino acid oxidase-like deaminating enzyme